MSSICTTTTSSYRKTERGWWRQTQISQEAYGKAREYLRGAEGGTGFGGLKLEFLLRGDFGAVGLLKAL